MSPLRLGRAARAVRRPAARRLAAPRLDKAWLKDKLDLLILGCIRCAILAAFVTIGAIVTSNITATLKTLVHGGGGPQPTQTHHVWKR